MRKNPKNRSTGLVKLLLLCFMAFLALGLLSFWINPLEVLGNFLIKKDPTEKADLIVVLSGDLWARANEAADLYNKGLANRILLLRELKRKGAEELQKMGIVFPESYQVNKRVLMKKGVPERAISISNKEVNSSFQEASFINEYLNTHQWKSVIVVTSKFHSRRACRTLKTISNGEKKVICSPSRYDPFSPETWWTERRQARALFFEYQKLIFYTIYLLLYRLNPF
jgi:uncharacterized SAM-binding protein YcdF (DUF218 family)